MKVAVAGDWHGNSEWALAAIDAAHEAGCRVLLHTGDLGVGMPNRRPYEQELETRLAERGMMLYFVRGTHDSHDAVHLLPRDDDGCRVVSDHVRMLEGWMRLEDGDGSVTLAGLGGASSSDRLERIRIEKANHVPRTLFWPEEVVSRFTVRSFLDKDTPRRFDIFLSHDGPIEAYSAGKLGFRESRDPFYQPSAEGDAIEISMARRRLKPVAHFFGHHHKRMSLWDGQSDHVELLECLGADGAPGNIVCYDTMSQRITELAVEVGNDDRG